MTYSQFTAFDLLNEGKSKTHISPPTGPSPRATHEQKQRRHRQTERKQAGKVQTMNFCPHQPNPSPPDDNSYPLRPHATPRDGPASGKNTSPRLTPLMNHTKDFKTLNL